MRRLLASVVAVVAASVAIVPTAGSQAAPADLAVADAFGFATPIGTVLRIPNQLDGGVLLSKSALNLDKSQAISAGFTPGELGEAFLQTTIVAPEGVPPEIGDQVAYTNPALFTAQTPPSEVFPAEAGLAGGGLDANGVQAGSLQATTTDRRADADAVGGLAVSQGELTFGSMGSRATSEILDDGTVVSEAHAFVSDLRVAGGLLRLGGIDSFARVSARPGAEPEMELRIDITGAQLAGVPVVIDQDGIRIADTGLLGIAELNSVNDALGALAGQGFGIALFPGIERESEPGSARVAGAALSIRGDLTDYVPTAVDTPLGPVGSPLGDVGTDNEILLGRVEASALAAERAPFPDGGLGSLPGVGDSPAPTASPAPSGGPAGSGSGAAAPTAPRPVATGTPLPTAVTPDPSPEPAGEIAAPATQPFELIRREAPPGVEALRIGYRWVLACTLAGVTAFLVRRRTRLI